MRLAVIIAVLGVLYLLFWPVDMHPQAWTPQAAPDAQGPYAPNDALAAAAFVPLPGGRIGPEDIAGLEGEPLYTADQDGTLYRIDGDAPMPVADLGGRPLGLDMAPDGRLIIADSYNGIRSWTPEGGLETIAAEIDGAPIIYANQLDIARDGTIYFSNSTDRFDPETLGGTKPTSVMAIWEQSPAGYVARIPPGGAPERIAEGFVYTNGVALSPDEDFLLIAETGRARVHKLWLTGPEANTRTVLMDNLPGYPDNIEPMGDGSYWMAFASPRVPAEMLMPYPLLRRIVWRLGPWVHPAPIEEGHMIRFDGEGRILASLRDPSGRLGITTGGRPFGDTLYVMTLDSPGFGRLALD
jgi:sugar lactone lactonase YvrE